VVVETAPSRGDVYLVGLNPTQGSEIRKTRPCVVVSPDELNALMGTYIVVPMTTGGHTYPFRVACQFEGKAGHIVVDQIRTVDRQRLEKRLGSVEPETLSAVLDVLLEMFAP